MDKLKIIFLYFSFGLLPVITYGQQIANYISNGSFEDSYNCSSTSIQTIKFWSDSTCQASARFSYCNGFVPNQFNTEYQIPRTGNTFIGSTFYYTFNSTRAYLKNRLKTNLQSGKTYCVKFYVNMMNTSTYGNDGFGIYFGNSSLDTITTCISARNYLTPQVKCPNGVPITDTLGWTPITGTFVANGTEKYAMIGIFKPNGMVDTVLINPTYGPSCFADACIDDVSCIPVDLLAYAGPDQFCIPGDSVFIGRQPDFATDSGCVWYKLPNMVTSIDTVSGLWVKPVVTTTYVVRQQLECSALKWDTVVVFQGLVGLKELKWYADNIKLFPNPSTDRLYISFPKGMDLDVGKTIVLNNLGQIIREENLEIKNGTTVIETSNFDPGSYQIHFEIKAGTVTKQFVKLN